MTHTFKTLAIAALLGTVSAPAFAAAHLNTSMTCGEFQALSAEDQTALATMAIAEIDDGENGTSMGGSARATATISGTSAEEATDGVAVEGSLISGEAKAVEPTGGNTEASNMTAVSTEQATFEEFAAICAQNSGATVTEAAAGIASTR